MKQTKIFEAYKKKADLLMNFQLVRKYFNSNDSILRLVERILKEKYNEPWQAKFISKAINNAQGVRDAVIEIPQFNYKEKVSNILAKFVENKFDRLVADLNAHGIGSEVKYPLTFRDIVERNS
jgi:hypothetical protein